jgi:hypothetical protein
MIRIMGTKAEDFKRELGSPGSDSCRARQEIIWKERRKRDGWAQERSGNKKRRKHLEALDLHRGAGKSIEHGAVAELRF